MEENNSKEFIEKIFDLSECLNSTKEETLLNFQNFFTLIQNNENKFKKMIVNRNNDVFKKTKFFNYTDNNLKKLRNKYNKTRKQSKKKSKKKKKYSNYSNFVVHIVDI